jgi:hypothetical protein
MVPVLLGFPAGRDAKCLAEVLLVDSLNGVIVPD